MTLLYACATVAEQGFLNFFLGDVISGLALIIFASPFALLEQTGWVARVVLGILLVLSLFSWAIIFQKSRL
ncbi:MAG TPA: hypothetical protein VN881_13960, partial [Candidatus Acidoferrales bacterium]|nr:hypothetical protein [Candidatus Acidoferrales bacterium]